ncbi:MAG: hypothetical protein EP346_00305 [Bacteroidetes bacterium]|nr:MAG: hypothetical protein EP346_00305 [Bacteroidota bacterium]
MNDVMAVLNGGSSNGLLSSRVNAYQASVIGFIENPIIGVLDFSSKKIGKHSEFVDKLAQFGLLGFALIWNIIRSSWKFAKTSGYLEFKISLVLLLIIGLVNTISLEFSVTVIAGGALLKLYDK